MNDSIIKKRISQYLDKKRISDYRFEKDLGLSKGYWNKAKNPSSDILMKICGLYTDISPDWLLTGEGDMLKDNKNGNSINVSGNNSGINVAGSTIQSNDNILGNSNVIGNNNHVSGSTNNGVNIILPEKGYQKIINSTGKETTIHLNNDDISAVASLSIENISLKEKIELLNQMVADFRERLKEKDDIINMYKGLIK